MSDAAHDYYEYQRIAHEVAMGYEDKIADLQRQNAAMRAALEKFADPGNWAIVDYPDTFLVNTVWKGDDDPAELAQKALKGE